MAISIPSDIVLDVARAADPATYGAAVAKLGRTPGSSGVDPARFAAMMDASAASPADVLGAFDPLRADMRGRLARTADAAGPAGEPFRKFEAFVLQSFVQSMLPKDAESVFGQGLAGDMWSSLLAEQIGAQIAEAGGIGIAAQIAPSQGKAAEQAIPGLGQPRFAGTPGFVASLEMGFADAVRPGASDGDG